MNPIEILEQEHRDIERELLELEAIRESEIVNIPNLIHVCKKLHDMWNKHEEKEERIFPILKKEKIIIPVKEMLFEHKILKPHKQAVDNAIDSGSEAEIKNALYGHVPIIIRKLREHIDKEDAVLYTIAMSEFTPEELAELWENIKD